MRDGGNYISYLRIIETVSDESRLCLDSTNLKNHKSTLCPPRYDYDAYLLSLRPKTQEVRLEEHYRAFR